MIREELLREVEKAKSLVLDELVKHEFCPIIKKSFVYFLWQENELIYIGQTYNLTNRLIQHSSKLSFDSYSFIKVDSCFSFQIESILIEKFLPPRNNDYKVKAIRDGMSLIKSHTKKTDTIKEQILEWIKNVVKGDHFNKNDVCRQFPSVSPISIGKYLLEFMYEGILYEIHNYCNPQEFVLTEKFNINKYKNIEL